MRVLHPPSSYRDVFTGQYAGKLFLVIGQSSLNLRQVFCNILRFLPTFLGLFLSGFFCLCNFYY